MNLLNSKLIKINNLIDNNFLKEAKDLLKQNKNIISKEKLKSYNSFLIKIKIKENNINEIYNLLIINNIFMKRDYFLYINKVYNLDREKAKYIFKLCLDKFILIDKDIDYLIKNNYIDLLKLLDMYCINTNLSNNFKNNYIEINFDYKTRLNIINTVIINNLDMRNKINKLLNNKKFNIIIDCGNLINRFKKK